MSLNIICELVFDGKIQNSIQIDLKKKLGALYRFDK